MQPYWERDAPPTGRAARSRKRDRIWETSRSANRANATDNAVMRDAYRGQRWRV